ncbi:hypothetical protein OG226_03665 [Streptomyces sp. NBC_01261]|nr:hypothetical protein [Streptomyces sp. NBC_01261]
MVEIVKAEAAERLEAAAQLATPAHAHGIARLRAEAAVLLRYFDDANPA